MKQASRSKEESFGISFEVMGPSGFPRDVERLAKLVTDDLSRPRPRNFANEVDAARHLVGRQVSPAVFEDGLALDLRTPSPGDHEQRRHLAKMRVRNPDDGAIHNALERVHDFLYFRRSNVLAAANDQFLQPSGDDLEDNRELDSNLE
jgi:predicted outer membrane protein